MSDSEDSTITYTAVSSLFEDGSYIGSPRVDGPPIMPEDPYAYCNGCFNQEEGEPARGGRLRIQRRMSSALPYDMDDDVIGDDIGRGLRHEEEEEGMHPARARLCPTFLPSPTISSAITIASLFAPLGYLECYDSTGRGSHSNSEKRMGNDLVLGTRLERVQLNCQLPLQIRMENGRADYGFVGTMDTEIRRQRAEEVGYGIRDVWVDPREAVEEETQLYQSVGHVVSLSVHYETARLLDLDVQKNLHSGSGFLEARHGVLPRGTALPVAGSGLTKALELLKGLQTQMAEFQRQLGPAKGSHSHDAQEGWISPIMLNTGALISRGTLEIDRLTAKVYAMGLCSRHGPNDKVIRGKRLEDVPVVQEFPKVFPEDLPRASGATTGYLRDKQLYKTLVPLPGSSTLTPAKDMNPIKDWASPKTPTEIRIFRPVGYYRRFIEWDFERSPQKLYSAPILALLTEGKRTSSSHMLMTSKMEKNYTTHDFNLGHLVWDGTVCSKDFGKAQLRLEVDDVITIAKFVNNPGRRMLFADALSRKEQETIRVFGPLSMAYWLWIFLKQILKAQTEMHESQDA
ncbi:hypothetical protein Tco_1547139 [Tanacetum coccineum]